jgi:ABC-2 type transport system permease protein
VRATAQRPLVTEARVVRGPSAVGGDPRRLWTLALQLAITDFRLKFFGSALGYLWQLMRPLMLFGVLYVVFGLLLDVGADEPYFPVALLLGIVLYSFFSEVTGTSVRSLATREGLIRKVEFPRLAVPLATLLTALMNLVLNLVPVFVFYLLAGGQPHWSWLQLPLLVALLSLLAVGLAMVLSVLFVRYRDVEPIWDVVLQIAFYASPILYSLAIVREKAGETAVHVLLLSPFAAVLQQARHAVVDPAYESTAAAMASPVWVLVPLALIGLAVALGYLTFRRAAPRIAEDL